MEQKDKELLLSDLCARLPYGVHLRASNTDDAELLDVVRDLDYDDQYWINGYYDIEDIKPYLRPMSSMTEEEVKKYQSILNRLDIIVGDYCYMIYDYFNSIHVDYRGLIKKGLAIEAPEGMYKGD